MKKETIILKVNQETINQIEELDLKLKDVVKEAFLRGVSHLRENKNILPENAFRKELKVSKEHKAKG